MVTSFTDWESGLYLQHHGVKGQKWGVRNYQNSDGTLTAAGRARYLKEGGSRSMGRQFNRQLRKLNRLEARTDIVKQRALSEKYSKRAKTGAKVAAGLAVGAAGSYLGDLGLHRAEAAGWLNTKKIHSKNWSDTLGKLQEWQRQEGGVDKATYGHMMNKIEREKSLYERAKDESKWHKDRSAFGSAGSSSLRTKIIAGAAAVAGGYAAYSAIRSKVAKNRTTDAGHKKAVEKYKAQYDKMISQFSNTPYSELLKKQKSGKTA